MKKIFFALTLAAFVLTMASCKDEPDFVDVYNPQNGIIAGEIIEEGNTHTLTKASNGYALYKTADKSLVGVYEDCQKLGYFAENNSIKYNYVLIDKADNGKYHVAKLTDSNGFENTADEYAQYACYGDYIVLDGVVYDGDLAQIGMIYGEVVSATPLSEGGTITFAEDFGVTRSYFYTKKVETPTQNKFMGSVYGSPEDLEFIIEGNNNYFRSGDTCYKFPYGSDKINAISAICDKNGVLRLNHPITDLIKEVGEITILYSNDGQNKRTFLAEPVRVDDGGAYFCGVDGATYTPEAAYFGEYDRYSSDVNPNAHWLVGANSTFIGFLGAPTVIDYDYGRTLMFHRGSLYKYDESDGGFDKIATFDKYAMLHTRQIIAKPEGKEEYVVYGKTGVPSAPIKCEKIHDLTTFGAAVSVGGEIRFLDEYGKVLANVSGYDKDLVLDTEKTGYEDYGVMYHLVFSDPELRNKEGILLMFDFWYNIETGEAGLYVGN